MKQHTPLILDKSISQKGSIVVSKWELEQVAYPNLSQPNQDAQRRIQNTQQSPNQKSNPKQTPHILQQQVLFFYQTNN
jgi:hypothetical protein